jgi:simple sugar transport system substrate-binding protein
MQRSASLSAIALATILISACGRQEAPAPKTEPSEPVEAPQSAPLKVGFVYVSPVGDAGWTSQHNAGREQMLKTLGTRIATTYVEKVPEGADAERVIRDLQSRATS